MTHFALDDRHPTCEITFLLLSITFLFVMKSARNCGNFSLTPSSSCCKILSNIYSWAGFLLGLSNVLAALKPDTSPCSAKRRQKPPLNGAFVSIPLNRPASTEWSGCAAGAFPSTPLNICFCDHFLLFLTSTLTLILTSSCLFNTAISASEIVLKLSLYLLEFMLCYDFKLLELFICVWMR